MLSESRTIPDALNVPRPLAQEDARTSPPWLDRDLYPFESRFLDVGGSRVHYIDEGHGPLLLFLHGAPCWSFQYRDVIRVLRQDFRCVALDYPGFGLSGAAPGYGYTLAEHSAVVETFVERMRLADITMVVHATGGPIGFGVAGRRPDLFRGFVISNTFAWPVTDTPSIRRMFGIVGSRPFGLLVRHANFLIRFFTAVGPGGTRRGKFSAAEKRAYRGPFERPSRRVAISEALRDVRRNPPFLSDVARGLARLREKPALILWGEHDRGRPVGWPGRWERTFPRHRSRLVRGAGHFLHDDAPIEIAEEIRPWAAGL